MIIYLTSDPDGHRLSENGPLSTPFSSKNGFRKRLLKDLPKEAKCLMICAFPDAYEENDTSCKVFTKSFEMTGINFKKIDLCDNRNPSLVDSINKYDYVLLFGGYVLLQNEFFRKINLKEKLQGFDGVIMGISAGSMNCANTVYAIPELDEEYLDKNFTKFVPGLGLTDLQIVPHFQFIKTVESNGISLFNDIILEDSIGKKFLAINDGSFVRIEKTKEKTSTEVFGEAYWITEKKIIQFSKDI